MRWVGSCSGLRPARLRSHLRLRELAIGLGLRDQPRDPRGGPQTECALQEGKVLPRFIPPARHRRRLFGLALAAEWGGRVQQATVEPLQAGQRDLGDLAGRGGRGQGGGDCSAPAAAPGGRVVGAHLSAGVIERLQGQDTAGVQ